MQAAIERLKLRVVEKMAEVDEGKSAYIAASELGLMPHEFFAIYYRVLGMQPPPPTQIEWE